jgi:16S rRNA (guanine527-N7)-methyltransferase
VFHVKHEGWAAVEELGLSLSEDQLELLEAFEELLIEHAIPGRMVSRNDGPRLRDRHILDCLRAAPLISNSANTGCDMGSGAGLPGVPLAIALPDLRITLVEVRRNRAAFLERTVADLELRNVTIHGRRLETYQAKADVCFARAFADARTAWTAASNRLTADGCLIYWAGERFAAETDVQKGVHLDLFPTPALARSGPLAIMSAQ